MTKHHYADIIWTMYAGCSSRLHVSLMRYIDTSIQKLSFTFFKF